MNTEAPRARRAGVGDWLSLIKFSHSVFALPFALIALLVATDGTPSALLLLAVVAAMVSARSAAMAYNRYADRRLDALNPRTAGRELPAGVLRPGAVLAFVLLCSAVFLAVCWSLGPACFWLGLPTLAVLLGYSHAKRFTSLSHLWLGVALGLAPPAAWVAARGAFTADIWPAVLLGLAVTCWVAGFDVLYACQDEEFDRGAGLRSLPARLGARRALLIARALHVVAAVGFVAFGVGSAAGVAYYLGVAVCAALLGWQHALVRADDLRRIDMAFFTMNGAVGLAMLGFVATDLYLRSRGA